MAGQGTTNVETRKSVVLPVILSETDVKPNKMHESIRHLEINPNIYIEMQKSIVVSTCSIARQFLQGNQENGGLRNRSPQFSTPNIQSEKKKYL